MKKIALISILFVSVLLITGCSKEGEVAGMQAERAFKGNKDARIVVLEYSDFQCPACSGAQEIVKEVLDQYQNNVRLEFRHFPLESIHPYAFQAAQAAECANQQGKFWEYHDLLFENQEHLKTNDLKLHASEVEGIDTEAFNVCLDEDRTKDAVKNDLAEAVSAGLRGTPTFLVNGTPVPDYTQLASYIQQALQ